VIENTPLVRTYKKEGYMPLIQITTIPGYHPPNDLSGLATISEWMIAEFASALPQLFMDNIEALHMDPNTKKVGIQVTHQKFHPLDINVPDVWILIEFSESDLNDVEQTLATAKVKELVLHWFEGSNHMLPTDYACDVRWSPSHGFLRIGDVSAEW